jgi:hypothetical protein
MKLKFTGLIVRNVELTKKQIYACYYHYHCYFLYHYYFCHNIATKAKDIKMKSSKNLEAVLNTMKKHDVQANRQKDVSAMTQEVFTETS